MDQQLALNILLDGHNVLLTGPAGSGKTYLLNQFIKLVKHGGRKVSVTATTGLAATHLGGTTIHSWSGIGIADSLTAGFAEHFSKGRLDIIGKTDILIIDEISMLHDYRLDMVDEVCRVVRKQPDKPFGGIQVVLCGDFFQLPPVNRSDSRAGGFVTNSMVWQELDLVVCYLEDQHRQNVEGLIEVLNSIRTGDVRRKHAERLLSRTEIDAPEGLRLTELHTVNVDVDTINAKELEKLDADEIAFEQTTTGSQNYIESLQRSVLAPDTLKLKVGALVMAVKNSTDKKYMNGSIGEVVSFEPGTDYPIIKFVNNQEVIMQPDTWELRDGDKKRASITQIPLRLAWAITIHKSQGMTLDAAQIDLRKAFVPGMGYVALSRLRSLDDLYLRGINQMALKVSDEALEIDNVLRSKTREDSVRFKHLRGSTTKLGTTAAKKPQVSGWAEKIEKMRKTFPNAYRPWTRADDELLKQDFQNGTSIAKLSKRLGRHEGSIVMRIKKHFGEEVEV